MIAAVNYHRTEARLAYDSDARRSMFSAKTDPPLADSDLRELRDRTQQVALTRTPQIAQLAAEAGYGGRAAVHAVGTYHVVHRIDSLDAPSIVVRSTIPDLTQQDRGLLLDRWAAHWLGGADSQLVPATLTVRFTTEGAPFDFALLAFAEGRALRDLGDAILDEKPALAGAIGRALRCVHGVEATGAGLIDLSDPMCAHPSGVHARWSGYITLRLDQHVSACVTAGAIDRPLARKIDRHFCALLADLDARPIRLLHGDPGNHNICLDTATERVTSLLDWEDAIAGDPLFELAMWSTFHPPHRLPTFLTGYGLPSPSLMERRLMALYFLRIALSKTVHRQRFGIVDLPGREPGHLRIHRAVVELDRLSDI
jgi:aminoglycoside phosphotransferase (APT) family kinase protein